MTRPALALLLALALVTGCKSKEEAPKPAAPAPAAPVAQAGRIDLVGPATGAGYSFDQKRQVGLESQELADLLLYFDANDCAQGAIFGHTDKTPLHVLGKKTWAELAATSAVPTTPPVTQVAPTFDLLGTGLLVQRKDGTWALVRVTEVQPATHEGLRGGGRAALAFEWAPTTLK